MTICFNPGLYVLGPRGAEVRPERPLDRVLVSLAWHGKCDRAAGPAPGSQAITDLWPIYSSGSVWLFGVLGDWGYSSLLVRSSHFPNFRALLR